MDRSRKKPFSGKQKKQQLRDKRIQKGLRDADDSDDNEKPKQPAAGHTPQPNLQPRARRDARDTANTQIVAGASEGQGERYIGFKQTGPVNRRLRTVFQAESKADVAERIKVSQIPFKHIADQRVLERVEDQGEDIIKVPVRPGWTFSDTIGQIERRENSVFADWLNEVRAHPKYGVINHFEQNLEVWRQLWRVIEMSDILLLTIDVRFAPLHFPTSLYNYACRDLKKPIVIILNKVDLVPRKLAFAWKQYFESMYSNVKCVFFTSKPQDGTVTNENVSRVLKNRKVPRKRKELFRKLRAYGIDAIFRAIQTLDVVQQKVRQNPSLLDEMKAATTSHVLEQSELDASEMPESSTQQKQKRKDECGSKGQQESTEESDDAGEGEDDDEEEENLELDDPESEPHEADSTCPPKEERPEDREHFITLGLVGNPNTGKSSTLNSLVGKTVTRVSRTPGKTKHFQTYFVTKNIRLCDSPGLVFPSVRTTKPLQVISGVFPLAQLREPYSAVQFLGEHVPVPLDKQYRLRPDAETSNISAFHLCEMYAQRNGLIVARTGRPDEFQAGRAILRHVNDGRIFFSFYPPGFHDGLWKEPDNEMDTELVNYAQLMQLSKLQEEELEKSQKAAKEESEEEDDEVEDSGAAPRVMNMFSLLQADDDDEDEDEDEEDDEK